ncbi:MAG: hemerythrin domain-containing protein [Marmoricola sp.]
MCDYCGCNGVEPIRELMDEHEALMDEAHHVREALGQADPTLALSLLERLVGHLGRHVRREEAGIFRALRDKGEFLEELSDLETEHRQFDATISTLHAGTPDLAVRVTKLLDDLGEHVEREDLGIFPISVVTLGMVGWQAVEDARAESPSFLLDTHAPTAVAVPVIAPA